MDIKQESGVAASSEPALPELVRWKVWGGNGKIDAPVAIPGLEGLLYSRPCESDRGGDLYYLSACGSGALARVCVADVTGHGESVSTFSGWLEEVFSRHIHRASPSVVLRDVNQRAAERGLALMSTAICFSYNSLNGWLSYCCAGHPPVRLCRAGEETWEPLFVEDNTGEELYNLPLAVDRGSRYTVGELQLVPGDRLLIHTDGLIEFMKPDGRQLGEVLWQPGRVPGSSATVEEVLRALRNAVGIDQEGTNLEDDLTIMVLEVLPYQVSGRCALFLKNNLYRMARTLLSSSR